MGTDEYGDLLLPSGGYRRLKSFQLAQLIYDITVHFVKLYIPKASRTCDQMVQAARSGVQNIAEGSIDAATSAKLELNLYNVARASLEELKLDYQDYLRQRGEKVWNKGEFLYAEFVNRRISCKKEFREFIVWAEGRSSVPLRTVPYKSVLVANGTVLLIETASYFLKRQIQNKSVIFLENGGFSERMHNMRTKKRKDH
ncbi:MAG: four helix bundle suffix domain-containing protein [Lentisphaeria bacterium]|nr:four helix bundle suffix domain-containing protein [Lentisphaeria bacterium]